MPTPPRARRGWADPELARYFCEMSSHALLAPGEDIALAARARTGDVQAMQRLALGNLKLVAKIASGFMGYGLPFPELVQEGNVGLMDAVRRYQPEKGKLSTYVAVWVRASILEYVKANWRPAKVGTTRNGRRVFFGLHRVREQLEASGGRADAAAIAAELGVSKSDVIDAEGRFAAPVPLDGMKDGSVWLRSVADPGCGPEAAVEAAEIRAVVRRRISGMGLSAGEREILSCRLLPEGDADRETMRSIGQRLKVSKQRVDQVKKKLLERLKVELADLAA